MRRFVARLLEFLRLTRRDADLRREIDAHLALMQDDYESRGMSPDAARRAARLAFGGIEQTRERHRDARSFASLEDARQDIALGLRLLRRSPLFTLTAALSLAIGIGANTAIFAVATSLLFRPPDAIEQPDRLVDIGTARGDGGLNPVPFAIYQDIARGVTALSGVFAEEMFPHAMSMRASERADAERITGQAVTATFFDVLGSRPHVGRGFADADEATAAAGVLDYDFWVRRFAGDPHVVGRVLRINDRGITIVGVAAPRFQGTGVQKRDVWLILPPSRRATVMVGGRLRDGASLAEVAAQVAAATEVSGRSSSAADGPRRVTALPFSRAGGNRNVVAAFAAALMTLVSLVLGIACANVAGIMVARANVRQDELALRTALGATRGRLIRQLLTEIVMLFLLGGAAGIMLAWGVVHIAGTLSPMPAVRVTIDWRVLAFALVLSLVAALLSGLLPALRGSQVQPATVLKDGVHSLGRSRSRAVFVAGQIALTVLLVALSGLFVRALRHAGSAAPGFDPHGVTLTTFDLSMAGGSLAADRFWRDALERVQRLPDVEAASLARVPPGGWEGIGLGGIDVPDHPGRLEGFSPSWNIVAPGYFAALRIPILRGRDFSQTDTADSPAVAIIADAVARRCWPGDNATGKYLTLSTYNPQTSRFEKRPALIVGVVGDIKSSSLIDGLAEPYVYLPVAQIAQTDFTKSLTIVTRSRHAGIRLQAQVERAIREIDPDLVAAQSDSLVEAIKFGLAPQRLLATVAGGLGLVGLLLASIGIYGVMAYTVAQRRREFGIRIALGAPRAAIVWIVLRQAMWIVTAGSVIGLSLATGVGEGLSAFLYGIPAAHAATFLGTVSVVAVASSVACYFPTRHAIGVEPLRALRTE